MESKVCLWLSSLLCFQGAGAHNEMCCTVPEVTCLCRADLALRSHWHTEGSWANTTALLPGLQGARGQQQREAAPHRQHAKTDFTRRMQE